MNNILLTGAGGSAAIGVARSLQKKPGNILFGVDRDKYKILRAETKNNTLITGKHFIKELNQVIEKYNIDFLHAQPWGEVYEVSKYRDKLNTKTFLPDHKTVETCTNKYSNYLVWKKSGLKVPYTKTIQCMYDLTEMVKKFRKVWIRASEGAGGKGSLIVDSYNLGFALEWIKLNVGFGSFLVSEYLSPDSVTFMSIWKDGELIVAQSRKRLYWEYGSKMLSGVSGITGAAITINDKIVNEVALESVYSVDKKPNGIFSVDMTYDKYGFPNPTEINIGSFFTTVDFFTEAGLNMPEIYVKLALDQKVKPIKLNPLPTGLTWIRGMDKKPVLIRRNKNEF